MNKNKYFHKTDNDLRKRFLMVDPKSNVKLKSLKKDIINFIENISKFLVNDPIDNTMINFLINLIFSWQSILLNYFDEYYNINNIIEETLLIQSKLQDKGRILIFNMPKQNKSNLKPRPEFLSSRVYTTNIYKLRKVSVYDGLDNERDLIFENSKTEENAFNLYKVLNFPFPKK